MRRCGGRPIGVGHRPIAARLDRPASTVRGWLRAFTGNAETVRAVFTALLVRARSADRPAAESIRAWFADAVEVVGACAAAARRRLGVVGAVSPWQLASAVTAGLLLAAGRAAASRSTRADPWGSRRDRRSSRLVCISTSREEKLMVFSHDEERVRAERARAVGLFRYSLIREAADPRLTHEAAGPAGPRASQSGSMRARSGSRCGYRGPRSTGGSGIGAAAGSTPWSRPRAGSAPRTPADVLELAVALKKGGARSGPRRRSRRSCGPMPAGRRTSGPCNATSSGWS